MNAPVATIRRGLTGRQLACFDAIKAFIAQHRISPSTRELADALGLRSLGAVNVLVAALAERGWITREPNKNRSIAIADDVSGVPAYALRGKTEAALRKYCTAAGEDPSVIVEDAVALFLDHRAVDGPAE